MALKYPDLFPAATSNKDIAWQNLTVEMYKDYLANKKHNGKPIQHGVMVKHRTALRHLFIVSRRSGAEAVWCRGGLVQRGRLRSPLMPRSPAPQAAKFEPAKDFKAALKTFLRGLPCFSCRPALRPALCLTLTHLVSRCTEP